MHWWTESYPESVESFTCILSRTPFTSTEWLAVSEWNTAGSSDDQGCICQQSMWNGQYLVVCQMGISVAQGIVCAQREICVALELVHVIVFGAKTPKIWNPSLKVKGNKNITVRYIGLCEKQ